MPTKEKFPISHVLVDCENVGLNGLLDLIVKTDGNPVKFVLFHNATNKLKDIPLDNLKDLGYAISEGRLETVALTIPEDMTKKQAENALDFYIAFYMGQVMPHEPFNSHCVILSKDRDYDPLVLHVQKEFDASRCERLDSYEKLAKRLGVDLKKEEAPKPESPAKKEVKVLVKTESKAKTAKQSSFDLNKSVAKAKKLLKGIKKNPPTTKTKLQHALKSWFSAETITDIEIQQLIEALHAAKVLTVATDGKKISY